MPVSKAWKPDNAQVFWSSFLVSDDGDNKKPVDVICAVQITFLIKIFSASKCYSRMDTQNYPTSYNIK